VSCGDKLVQCSIPQFPSSRQSQDLSQAHRHLPLSTTFWVACLIGMSILTSQPDWDKCVTVQALHLPGVAWGTATWHRVADRLPTLVQSARDKAEAWVLAAVQGLERNWSVKAWLSALECELLSQLVLISGLNQSCAETCMKILTKPQNQDKTSVEALVILDACVACCSDGRCGEMVGWRIWHIFTSLPNSDPSPTFIVIIQLSNVSADAGMW